MPFGKLNIAVVIPAHNEQDSVGLVVNDILALNHNGQRLVDDLVVCDNQSTDNTAKIATNAGAHVVYEPRKGYGAACLAAIAALDGFSKPKPDIVVFVDADNSVEPNELITLIKPIADGADLVVGSRNNKRRQKGALSMHQRFGNSLASALIRLIWKKQVTDLGPFRALPYQRLKQLNMQDKRFGWTVEMQVKAIQAGFRYMEIPVTTKLRIGVSKISGTVRGTIGAAIGIFGKIFQLYLDEQQFIESLNNNNNQNIALSKQTETKS